MNSTPVSATLRTPVGATIAFRRAAMTKMTMPISAARQAINAILLKVGKMSFHWMTSLIGGNSRASIGDLPRRLEVRIGQGEGYVLELPHQEPEMSDDDGRSERGQRNPAGVAHQEHGGEDQAQPQQVAEQDGGQHQRQRDPD